MSANGPKSEQPGGLQIVATSDDLTVTKFASRSPKAYLIGVGIFIYLWFLCINLVGQAAGALRLAGQPLTVTTDLMTSLSVFAFPLLGGVVFVWTVFQWARSLLAGREVVRCNRRSVEITTISVGRVRRRAYFAIDEVKAFEFEAWASKRGAVGGMSFMGRGKPVNFFKGVKAAEARRFLLEVSRFGVDAVVDLHSR